MRCLNRTVIFQYAPKQLALTCMQELSVIVCYDMQLHSTLRTMNHCKLIQHIDTSIGTCFSGFGLGPFQRRAISSRTTPRVMITCSNTFVYTVCVYYHTFLDQYSADEQCLAFLGSWVIGSFLGLLPGTVPPCSLSPSLPL